MLLDVIAVYFSIGLLFSIIYSDTFLIRRYRLLFAISCLFIWPIWWLIYRFNK
jgi:hypothetical protein